MHAVDVARDFRTLRVLVIGDAMLDSYLEGSASRLCTEGPVPVVRRTGEERAPGGAANAAANLTALGADTVFLGVVGSDPEAALLRSALCQRGVDCSRLVEDEGFSTLHKMRILADDQYVVRFDAGGPRSPSRATQEKLERALDQVLPTCDLVVISDYGYGAISDALIYRLRSLRAARPCPLVVDSKDLRRFRRAGATVVTPNHLEARLAVDRTVADPGRVDVSDVERTGRRLLTIIDADHAAITMAGDGVLVVSRSGRSEHVPSHPVPHANDVGAGDSFSASLALALGAGADPVQAARIGVAAASIAVTKRRTAIVHHQELLQRISRADGVSPPSIEALAGDLERERLRGRCIVFTNGVFDLLHAGHIYFLREARSLGDVLVVGVNSDASASRLKGKNRPITSEVDRLALVAALDSVDHAILFDEETPIELISALRPHVHVKGGDYSGQPLPEADAVREAGGELVILPLVGDLSTSSVIERILTLAQSEAHG